jgi:hypothetical protein
MEMQARLLDGCAGAEKNLILKEAMLLNAINVMIDMKNKD